MSLFDFARWIVLIEAAAGSLVILGMSGWWFVDRDGFNRRFSSLARAFQIGMCIFALNRAVEGDYMATLIIAGLSCLLAIIWSMALVNYLWRRATA